MRLNRVKSLSDFLLQRCHYVGLDIGSNGVRLGNWAGGMEGGGGPFLCVHGLSYGRVTPLSICCLGKGEGGYGFVSVNPSCVCVCVCATSTHSVGACDVCSKDWVTGAVDMVTCGGLVRPGGRRTVRY